MNWHLLEYYPNTGKYNMDYDLQLVKNCNPSDAYLRFYGWEPACISLGANQSYNDIDQKNATTNNIDIVKRPTGGRAILHSEELTYSVIIDNNSKVSGKDYYEYISKAIVCGLKIYNSKLDEVMLENQQPDFSKLLNEPSGALCFASTAKSEIKFRGKKIVGSAQRKLGNTILQHGSILIGKGHRFLVDYLNVDEFQRNILRTEIETNTTEIESITNTSVDILDLQRCIILGFNKIFNANILHKELSATPT